VERIVLGDPAGIPEGGMRGYQIDGDRRLLVCNIAGGYHALGDTCPHRNASLATGSLDGPVLTCPWHGWQFDATTGRGITNPHAQIAAHRVAVEDGVLVAYLY
jgi:nitrite reductase/ring-hydroxylating ferredoxin subunit